jgi:hypothetical protein
MLTVPVVSPKLARYLGRKHNQPEQGKDSQAPEMPLGN